MSNGFGTIKNKESEFIKYEPKRYLKPKKEEELEERSKNIMI